MATKAEIQARVDEVFRMILTGMHSDLIVQKIAEKHEIKERQARNYIAKANEQIARIAHVDRAAEFGRAVAQLNALYAASLKLQDFRTCLSIRRELNSLLRLAPPPETAPAPALKTAADVLQVIETELGAMLGTEPGQDRARTVQGLALTGLRTLEISEMEPRIAALEALLDQKENKP